jgi:hypothetical protein
MKGILSMNRVILPGRVILPQPNFLDDYDLKAVLTVFHLSLFLSSCLPSESKSHLKHSTVLASAIDTLVRGTGAAHRRQFLCNCLPGTVEPNGRIIGRRPPGPGKGLHGFPGQIDLLNGGTVLRLQVADDFLNARTCLSL